MSPRQRGAVWFLALFLCGRSLDFFSLPFIARHPRAAVSDSLASPAPLAPRDTTANAAAPSPVAAGVSGATAAADSAAPIAINRATAQELQRLPRVGPVLAARIVAHREAHGPFRQATDLERVPGIGPRTAARLAPLVRFD